MSEDPGVHVGNAEVVAKTTRAVLVWITELKMKLWVPNSQFHEDSEVWDEATIGEEGELVVKTWFAEREGLDR